MAAVIASQATISGTFSMTKQAIALGLLPRMRVLHTSESEIGQIYIPAVNWLQLIVVLIAVIGFGSSDKLAGAYGIAVTATMLATTILTFFLTRYRWHLPLALCFGATGFFIIMDIMLFSASTLKLFHGGWFPLLLGAVLFTVMLTWKRGRELVFENLQKHAIPLEDFLASLFVAPPTRVLRHRHFPARRKRRRAARAAAQPVAQQGAARARGVPDGAHARSAVGAARRTGERGRAGPQLLPAQCRTTASRTSRTSRKCWPNASSMGCRSR